MNATTAAAPQGRSVHPWLVVAGSALALTVGNGPIMQFTFGVFLKPIQEALGTDRGTTSLALTAGLLTTALFLPIAGSVADKIGSRRLALIAASAFALCMVALGLLANSFVTFLAIFIVAGAVASGQTPLPYVKAVTAVFDRNRGLALGLTLNGVGIGSIVVPQIAQYLLTHYGWQGGYIGLGILIFVVAIPAILVCLPRSERAAAAATTGAPTADPLPGLTLAEAFRSRHFWLMIVGLFLAAAATNGTIAHVAPLLTDRGVPADQAVTALAFAGAASIVGRLVAGPLLDRFWAPLVSLIFLFGIIAGISILILAPDVDTARGAVVLIGLGLGLEADLVGFLLSRYLGLRAFGAIFGYVFGAFILASSLGPVIMGITFDRTGSYNPCLMMFIGFLCCSIIAFFALGKYQYAAKAKPAAH